MKLTNEDVGRWLVRTHQRIETFSAPKGCGFYVSAMILDTVVYVIFAGSPNTAVFKNSDELAAAYGKKGSLRRRFRDWRVARFIGKAIKEEGK
jgi:hypothetical protein